MNKALVEYLSEFITEDRKELFNRVIEDRTRYITVVLEDIYQSQNASAVLRSCDCFGIQDVHIIENKNEFNVNPKVAMGATKWLNIHKYNDNEQNTLHAIQALKRDGYRVVATTPHDKSCALPDFNLEKGKTALVFGTELVGISDVVKNNADEFLYIPMMVFTECFNISVSVALILYNLTQKLHSSNIDWKLTENERNSVLHQWLKRSIKRSDRIEERFLKS